MAKKIVILILAVMTSVSASALELTWGRARNVILIIPDGCSIAMWASIRAMTVGTDGMLNVDKLPVQSRCRTYSADAMITDSAAAATAYACGKKTRNGVIGMNAATTRGDSLSGKPIESILEMAVKAGYATGIVTTASVQHATAAAFYAHRADRNWYELITDDLVRAGIDVIMGGGREYMIPQGTLGEERKLSKRNDNRNIIDEIRKEGYDYVHDRVGFESIDPEQTDKLLGMFNAGHMNYEYDRKHDINGEPSLWEMTEKALDILSRNKKGFFLLVEAVRIDHSAHEHDTIRFLWEGIACDKAVGVTMEFARKHKNTLVIVVPDHGTGGPHLVGLYEISGKDSTVVLYDKAGFPDYGLNRDGFPVRDGGKSIALEWVDWTGNTGEDVGIHAMGPGSDKLSGLVQNIHIFRVMGEHFRFKEFQKKIKDLSEIIDF